MEAIRHVPVLADQCVALASPCLARPGALYVDATLGMGGHTAAMLSACPAARAIGIDRDPQALELARANLGQLAQRVDFVHATYDQIPQILAERGQAGADVILMDLGCSSFQLDEDARGFSYARDVALDMRMDPTQEVDAAGLLASSSRDEIARILREYGQERFAGRIADAIVRFRATQPLQRSGQLVDLVRQAIPAPARRKGGNPAKRTFQALRIAVNRELQILTAALEGALDALTPGGRLIVEAYHSGEDRIVKQALQRRTRVDAPADLPLRADQLGAEYTLLTAGALKADAAEIQTNPRCASVRLRAIARNHPREDQS